VEFEEHGPAPGQDKAAARAPVQAMGEFEELPFRVTVTKPLDQPA
jgi:hypothetical protein